jgi:hypothetical protein
MKTPQALAHARQALAHARQHRGPDQQQSCLHSVEQWGFRPIRCSPATTTKEEGTQ